MTSSEVQLTRGYRSSRLRFGEARAGEAFGPRAAILQIVSAVFVFMNAVGLSLAREGRLLWNHLWAPVAWLFLIVLAQVVLAKRNLRYDGYLVPIYGILTGWGLILIDRLAPNFLLRQVIWLTLGTMVMVGVAIMPRGLNNLRRYRYTWLTAGLLLLAATLILGVNPSGQGARLWLSVPLLRDVYFQPSELLKPLLVVFLAAYFEARWKPLSLGNRHASGSMLSYLAPLLLMWGFSLVLLVWQRDLGAATLFFVVFLALLYLAIGSKRYVIVGILLLLFAGVIGYAAFDVVSLRVDTWLNPWPEASGRGYQIVQSLYAIAAGGVMGQGIFQGFPEYIPVVHSDFAFSAIVEEWGLLGGLAVIACFGVLTYRGMRIAYELRRPFHLYLAAGVSLIIGVQALLIMSGVAKILPLTGVTLPFVSYGGSSLLISSLMVGLLLNLSSRNG